MPMADATSRWRHSWNRFEAVAGLIAMFVLSFGPPTVAGLMMIVCLLMQEWSAAGACLLITGLTGCMAVWLAKMAGAAVEKFLARSPAGTLLAVSARDIHGTRFERQVPFALLMVAELPRLPMIARLPLAVWWFAHFAVASAIVVFNNLPMRQGIAPGLFALFLCFLFTFAANVFLMLAVSIGFWSPTVTGRVWHFRFFIDVLLVLPALLGGVF